jgi:hypothetical protein
MVSSTISRRWLCNLTLILVKQELFTGIQHDVQTMVVSFNNIVLDTSKQFLLHQYQG